MPIMNLQRSMFSLNILVGTYFLTRSMVKTGEFTHVSDNLQLYDRNAIYNSTHNPYTPKTSYDARHKWMENKHYKDVFAIDTARFIDISFRSFLVVAAIAAGQPHLMLASTMAFALSTALYTKYVTEAERDGMNAMISTVAINLTDGQCPSHKDMVNLVGYASTLDTNPLWMSVPETVSICTNAAIGVYTSAKIVRGMGNPENEKLTLIAGIVKAGIMPALAYTRFEYMNYLETFNEKHYKPMFDDVLHKTLFKCDAQNKVIAEFYCGSGSVALTEKLDMILAGECEQLVGVSEEL